MKQQLLLLLLLSCSTALFAQDKTEAEKEKFWKDTLDVAAVFSEGNTISNTFSLKNNLIYEKAKNKFTFGALTIHKDITSETQTAIRQEDGSIELIKESDSETIEEKYGLKAAYERKLVKKWYFESVVDWYRDSFSGIDSRTSLHAGFGHYFVNTKTRKFKLGAALGYTVEEPTIDESGQEEDYLSVRVAYEWMVKFKPNSVFEQKFEVSGNGDESEDIRGILDTTIANKFNDSLALKAGLLLIWDNQPSLINVPIEDTLGTNVGNLRVESDELDSVLTMSLSISF